MKFLSWSLIATTLLFTSCSSDNDTTPELIKNYSTLIVNQGNYSERNGSLSVYQENTNSVVNLAFVKGNDNRPLASLVESFVHNGRVGLIICNNPSKIEVVDMNDLRTITAPLQSNEVANPRYGVISGSYAYVTCWGNDTEKIGEYPNGWGDILSYAHSYILKINLSTQAIEKTISCKADAEGIAAYNGKLFVAVAEGVRVFDLATDTEIAMVKHTTLSGDAKQLVVDKNSKLWYSVSSTRDDVTKGLVRVNTSTYTVEQEVGIENIEASIAITKSKDKIVYIKTSYYPTQKSELYTIDVTTMAQNTTPVYSGTGLIGVAVNPESGNIYTAELHDYTTNSTMKVFKEDGTLVYEQRVGVAASYFVFL